MSRVFPKMVSLLRRSGYTLYEKPGELNIVGVRGASKRAGRFDDELHVFCRKPSGTGWEYRVYKVTTDPGLYWLNSPKGNPLGTAILEQGQYTDAYQIGLHKGLYAALVQRGDVTVIRDFDKDNRLDTKGRRKETGRFGINIHRAAAKGKTKQVGEWSAGCTVFADPDEFAEFMALCERHRQKHGNRFTYTLFDFRDRWRERLRRVAWAGAAAAGLYAGYRVARDPSLLSETIEELKDTYRRWKQPDEQPA